MKLIVGQGNPGLDYEQTRHNIGYRCLDDLACKFETSFEAKPKWKADIADFKYHGQKVLLVKPTGFYNLTGQVVQKIAQFYQIDTTKDLLIIHDDLDLQFGVIRARKQGRDAGNNGLKSIINQIGTSFNRIKIGTQNIIAAHIDKASFVLSQFSKEELQQLPLIFKAVESLTQDFLDDRFDLSHQIQRSYAEKHSLFPSVFKGSSE